MTTLVFGGSFDPPHRGHAELLAAAARRLRPDRIVLVPACRSPWKGAPSAPAEARAELLRREVLARLPRRWRRRARVDLSEARARRPVYTVETLSRLARRGGRLAFLCGADAAAGFPRWKEPERLKSLADWWAGKRRGEGGRLPSHFRLLPGTFPGVSSTDLRRRLALGLKTGTDLSRASRELIGERGLYGTGTLRRLRKTLSPSRFEHTLAVAGWAAELAGRHGLDAGKALAAGLLHDCGRRLKVWEMPAYARRRRLPVPLLEETARRAPILLHAHISADLARREFGVEDPEVLAAVSSHTLGRAGMGPLEALVFVADATSPDRAHSGAAKGRRLAARDIAAALRHCLGLKISAAAAGGDWIHPASIRAWNGLAS